MKFSIIVLLLIYVEAKHLRFIFSQILSIIGLISTIIIYFLNYIENYYNVSVYGISFLKRGNPIHGIFELLVLITAVTFVLRLVIYFICSYKTLKNKGT